MKKFLLGSVALAALGFGAPAIAADMAVRPVAAAPAFSWTGCHVGGLVGWEWSGSTNGYTTTGASTTISATPAPAGVDYAPLVLKGHWTIRAEYLYVRFRDYTAFTAPIFGSFGGFSNLSTSLDNHIVRFGLAYKFGPNSAAQFR